MNDFTALHHILCILIDEIKDDRIVLTENFTNEIIKLLKSKAQKRKTDDNMPNKKVIDVDAGKERIMKLIPSSGTSINTPKKKISLLRKKNQKEESKNNIEDELNTTFDEGKKDNDDDGPDDDFIFTQNGE